jgi:uncharacterized membrane protein YqjE
MASSNRPVSAVLQDILGNVQDIVRSEVRLVKTELREEVGKAQSAGVLVVIGAVASIFSALFLLLSIVRALSLVVPEWLAALIVAFGIAVVAGVTLGAGVKRFKTVHAAPKSLKENIEWAKQLTR